MSSPFLRGLQAGVQLGTTYRGSKRQQELDKRADDEYQRQEKFREELAALQKARFEGSGDFADAPQQQMGLPTDYAESPEAQTMQTPPKAPMNAVQKDKLFYSRMAELGTKYLSPDKALPWGQAVKTLEKENYAEGMLNAFKGAVAGDKRALENLATMYQGVENGHNIDVSLARWDPQGKRWTGVQNVYEDGSREPTSLGAEELAQGFEYLTPASVASSRAAALARKGQEADRQLTRDRFAYQQKRDGVQDQQFNERLAFDRDKFKADVENTKALRRYQLASLDVQAQEVALRKAALEKDENAKDLLSRQTMFIKSFDPGIKLDEMSSDEDKARVESAKEMAALATSIYGISSEGADAKSRNAIAAETEQFIRGFASRSLDPSKLKRDKDGTIRYGRLVIPASMVTEDAATTRTPRGLSTTGSY